MRTKFPDGGSSSKRKIEALARRRRPGRAEEEPALAG
jgi:hypothetical protein